MTFEEKKTMLESAIQPLKSQGLKVFRHYHESFKSMWLIVTRDGSTTSNVYCDMYHYTCSSNWNHTPGVDTGQGISILEHGDCNDATELVKYVEEALLPPIQSWYGRKYPGNALRIKPKTIDDVKREYEKLKWSLEEM